MISILFRFINLALITGIGVYLMRRFVLPRLKQGIRQYEQEKVMFEREQVTLQNLHTQLDRDLAAQDTLCAELSDKVDRWQQQVLTEKAQMQQEQVQLYAALEERHNIQQKQYSIMHTVKQVTPVVQQQLEKELSAYYAHEAQAQEYIDALLEYLRKST